ncbi:MAG TPA: polysulfide reductase NrfD [Spirochaetota bacterium]|nr:polysulfide reductase NrfD [Spirochaetota bacterium]HPQ53422.1 polysulfide reductase NrfD [Spirochaetota bacterium]
MLEKVLTGKKHYWMLIGGLLALMIPGIFFYVKQIQEGLAVTGMSRDVSWGLYISQFTFLVGVAASAVVVVIPYYLHNIKQFGRLVILGEFLAVSAVFMCLLFIFADMGQPFRILNVLLYPSPNSLMFWDTVALLGYLVLNLVIAWTALSAEYKGVPVPGWITPLIYLSIPWAISIHTVTAFLYAGLPGRPLWLTSIMGARFIASAFASGPSLLILLCLIVRKYTSFDPGIPQLKAVARIVIYALIINLFFIILEFFTAYYSGIPSHRHSLEYLYFGLTGNGSLVWFMRISLVLGVAGLAGLLFQSKRENTTLLTVSLIAVFFSVWLDKGLGLVVGGFIPTPFESITEYSPAITEIAVSLSIFAVGFLILTMLYKIVITIRVSNEG